MNKRDYTEINGLLIGAIIGVLLAMAAVFLSLFIVKAETVLPNSAATARSILRASVKLEEKLPEYDLDKDGEVTAADARIALHMAIFIPKIDEKIEEETEEEIEYFQIGVLSTCGLTTDQLTNGLRYNLKQYAWAFLAAEKEYNVNAVFLAAIAAHESGWGRSYLAVNKNNFFGWRGSNGYAYFSSPVEGIMHVAKTLRNNYLSSNGSCFHGYTVAAVSICYCPGSNWDSYINNLMWMIQRDSY